MTISISQHPYYQCGRVKRTAHHGKNAALPILQLIYLISQKRKKETGEGNGEGWRDGGRERERERVCVSDNNEWWGGEKEGRERQHSRTCV